jgi:uncharacterized protein
MRSSSAAFKLAIRLHIHAANVQSICRFIDFCSDEFESDARFTILLEKIRRYDKLHDVRVRLASDADMRTVREHLYSLANRIIAADLSDTMCCYAALPNYFVIRADGLVQKCTVALYDNRNGIGVLQSDGTFAWDDPKKISAWASGLLEGDITKLSCPWIGISRNMS